MQPFLLLYILRLMNGQFPASESADYTISTMRLSVK